METNQGQLSTEQILSAVTQLSLPELEQVFNRVLAIQAERRAPHLSTVESSLLACINQGLPEDLRARLRELKAKRESDSITDVEYEELTRLSDQVEVLHAERMAAMAELAKLRGLGLSAMMDQLGIRFPENV